MAYDYNSYIGNNDFRGFLAKNAPQYLSFTGNDGNVDLNALARDIYGVGNKIGDAATYIRQAQSNANKDANYTRYEYTPSIVSGLYDNWSAAQNNQKNNTTTLDNYNGSGGVGAGGSANLQALAQLGQSAGIIQNSLDRLPGQLDIARGNINRQYETGINELNSNRAASENNFNQSTIQNQQGFRTNKNTINDQASQGLRGLSRILGSFGAVGSDMGLAGQAVAGVASAQNAGAGQNYSQNQQALDTNWGNYKNQWENEKRKRDDWKSQQMNEVEARSNSTRQDLLSRLASIRGEEAAARGGSFAGAAQPFIDQANQLGGRIDELGRINPTYTGNTPVYNAPSLGSYSAGNGAVTALQERVQGGMNTPYLNALLGRDRERKLGL